MSRLAEAFASGINVLTPPMQRLGCDGLYLNGRVCQRARESPSVDIHYSKHAA